MMNTDPNGYGAAAQDRRIEQLKTERDRYKALYKQRGTDAADAEDQLAGAVEALRSLRAAWDQHMATCPQHAKVPSPEEIDAWMNAPSNTASASLAFPEQEAS